MKRIARASVLAITFCVLIGVLYRYWLIYPILQHLTIAQWRLLATVIVAMIGAISAVLRLGTLTFTPIVAVGLLAGGTWASMSAPHDIRTTLAMDFMSHLEALWGDVLRLIVVGTLSNFCSVYLFSKSWAREL